MNISSRFWLAMVLLVVLGGPLSAAEVRIIAWNVEDTGADPRANENRLRQLARQGFDLWGLCEVQAGNFNRYLNAVNDGVTAAGLDAEYQPIEGESGGSRRLLLLFNSRRFEKLDDFALSGLQFGSGGRAPLCIKVRDKETDRQFLFSVNHFHRTNDEKRRDQAVGFRQYAAGQALPIITVGDFNFDVDVPFGRGNESFRLFTEGDVLRWIKPAVLVATNWSDRSNFPRGLNDFNSVLDFVFVAGDAKDWKAESRIIVRAGDLPDTEETSDHRPVAAVIDVPPTP